MGSALTAPMFEGTFPKTKTTCLPETEAQAMVLILKKRSIKAYEACVLNPVDEEQCNKAQANYNTICEKILSRCANSPDIQKHLEFY